MAFFDWKDEYSCGIETIDAQHKEIIRLMNELYGAICHETEEAIIKEVFVSLLRYANYHFTTELALFEEYHYEGEARHVAEHNIFIAKVKDLMISDYLTNRNIPLETLHFLKNWFENHIRKTDIEYCRFFGQRQLMDEIEAFLQGAEGGLAR